MRPHQILHTLGCPSDIMYCFGKTRYTAGGSQLPRHLLIHPRRGRKESSAATCCATYHCDMRLRLEKPTFSKIGCPGTRDFQQAILYTARVLIHPNSALGLFYRRNVSLKYYWMLKPVEKGAATHSYNLDSCRGRPKNHTSPESLKAVHFGYVIYHAFKVLRCVLCSFDTQSFLHVHAQARESTMVHSPGL